MENVRNMVLCLIILCGCDDAVVEPSSLDELLHGTYTGVVLYWIPSGSTAQEGMYCACPTSQTGIYLSPNGDFVMRIVARVERRDTVYGVTLSGYYEVSTTRFNGGGGGTMSYWEGELDFSPIEGQPVHTHFSIQMP